MNFLSRAMAGTAALLILLAPSAKAQLSVYATASLTNYGQTVNSSPLVISRDLGGVACGAMYLFPLSERLTLGIDARGAFAPAATGGEKAFVAARFGFVPHRNPVRPYVQVGVGSITAKYLRTTNVVGAGSVTTVAFDIALGLDVRLTPTLDWRAIEIESGAGEKGSEQSGSASVSTGIVYHFHAS
jgi:hypothetical protein